LSPPFLKLTFITLLLLGSSTSSSSTSGEVGRVAGADIAIGLEILAGSFVPQISHSTREGWFRNVHAGQPLELCSRDPAEDVETEVSWWTELEGRDVERCCVEDDWSEPERGTPQSSQTCTDDGLCPGGFLFLLLHTSHSHAPRSKLGDVPDIARAPLESALLVFTPLPARYKVTLGDEVNSPA
jgi:hypothetical protein